MFFGDKVFLENDKAVELYEYAKSLPIFDYHCHLAPQDILGDKVFLNLTELWLNGDHYKWRIMRAYGVDEKFITGDGGVAFRNLKPKECRWTLLPLPAMANRRCTPIFRRW